MVTAFGREDVRTQAEEIGNRRLSAEAGEPVAAL